MGLRASRRAVPSLRNGDPGAEAGAERPGHILVSGVPAWHLAVAVGRVEHLLNRQADAIELIEIKALEQARRHAQFANAGVVLSGHGRGEYYDRNVVIIRRCADVFENLDAVLLWKVQV